LKTKAKKSESKPPPEPDGDGSGPLSNLVLEQLRNILASPGFRSNARTCAFLEHIVLEVLGGRGNQIKESTIGVEVFGRDPAYDTKADPVVRSVARVVREKLNEYNLNDGLGRPIRIEMPKGTYVPKFISDVALVPPETQGRQTALPPFIEFYRRYSLIVIAILVVAAASLLPPRLHLLDSNTPSQTNNLPRDSRKSSELYRAGREQYFRGDFVGARAMLERSVAFDPQNALAEAALADDLRILGYDTEATELAKSAVGHATGLAADANLIIEASFRSALGDHLAAEHAYAKLAAASPRNLQYGLALAQAQMESGEHADCLDTLVRLDGLSGQPATQDPRLLLLKSLCLGASGNFQAALPVDVRAASIARESGRRELYARALLLQAGLMMSSGMRDKSPPLLEEARKICSELHDDGCAIKALRVRANLDVADDPVRALREYGEALTLARSIGSTRETIELLNGEGFARQQIGDYAQANSSYVDALQVARQLNRPAARVETSLVEVNLQQGELARAGAIVRQAVNDAGAAEDHDVQCYAQILAAKLALFKADLKDSAAILRSSCRDNASLSPETRGVYMLTKASLQRVAGNSLEAENLLAQARPLLQLPIERMEYSLTRGDLLIDMGRFQEARRLAAEAGLQSRQPGHPEHARALALLSNAYGYDGNVDAAQRIAAEARSSLPPHPPADEQLSVWIAAGRWSPRPDESAELLNRAIELAEQLNLVVLEQEARLASIENRSRTGIANHLSNASALAVTRQMGLLALARRVERTPGRPLSVHSAVDKKERRQSWMSY